MVEGLAVNTRDSVDIINRFKSLQDDRRARTFDKITRRLAGKTSLRERTK